MKRIGIVGAGPAGIMAALASARGGAQVLLFDRNQVIGRKLLVTGNGRCNLSNSQVSARRYTCADAEYLAAVFDQYGREQLLADLDDLGILTYCTPDGWYYPLSNSAAAVAAAFEVALQLAGVELCLQTKISNLRPDRGQFILELGGPSQTMAFDRVILATGGKAYPALGSKGELFPVLKRLGHTVQPVLPALVPIRAEVKQFHKLQGVRLDVGLALYQGKRKLGETVGNLMFTQFGFSGPAAMDLSHLVSSFLETGRPDTSVELVINLLPNHQKALKTLIARKRQQPVPLKIVLGSVLPVKIPPVMIELAGLTADLSLQQVSDRELEHLLDRLTRLRVEVKGTRGFQFSQLSTGGVPLTEVEPTTMVSQRVKNLYLAGEILDVVGPCGGYNLQFAFSTGAIAGRAAAG